VQVDVLTAVSKKVANGMPYSRIYEPLSFQRNLQSLLSVWVDSDALSHQGRSTLMTDTSD